mmetsp:Transcript_4959/g.10671  ORF Transcript_4959/g.10671 Transcript_4959/m.10671 type:complete len:245 (-) Transcript_4959:864-1598(-)
MAKLILIAVALALLGLVHGHGGGLHAWDFDTPGYNYTRYLLATCADFTPYQPRTSAQTPGPIPFWPSDNKTVNVVGGIEVYLYLDTTCRVTSTLVPYLGLTVNGSAYADKKVYAWGFTGGACNSSAGVGDLYRLNTTLGTTRTNLVWWREGVTDGNGTLWGSAPNMLNIRRPGPNVTQPMTSILLQPNPADSPQLCCNMRWEAALPAWFDDAIKTCVADDSGPNYNRHRVRRRHKAKRARKALA